VTQGEVAFVAHPDSGPARATADRVSCPLLRLTAGDVGPSLHSGLPKRANHPIGTFRLNERPAALHQMEAVVRHDDCRSEAGAGPCDDDGGAPDLVWVTPHGRFVYRFPTPPPAPQLALPPLRTTSTTRVRSCTTATATVARDDAASTVTYDGTGSGAGAMTPYAQLSIVRSGVAGAGGSGVGGGGHASSARAARASARRAAKAGASIALWPPLKAAPTPLMPSRRLSAGSHGRGARGGVCDGGDDDVDMLVRRDACSAAIEAGGRGGLGDGRRACAVGAFCSEAGSSGHAQSAGEHVVVGEVETWLAGGEAPGRDDACGDVGTMQWASDGVGWT